MKPNERRVEAQPLVHFEANGSKTGGAQQDGAMSADGLYPNGTTASGPHDQEMNPALSGGLSSSLQFKIHVIVPLQISKVTASRSVHIHYTVMGCG